MSQPAVAPAPPRIFVSHSHEDTAFCREFVTGLRAHHVDVWYDEHNLGWGMLHQVISRQLDTRDCFIVILSPAAVASRWVNREIGAALDLEGEGRITSFVVVVAAPCDIPALLRGYRRIQSPTSAPLSASDAAERAFRAVLSEKASMQNATSAIPIEPAAPTNALSTSDAGVGEPPPPERKPLSIIAPPDAAQSDLPAAALALPAPFAVTPDTPDVLQTTPPATAGGMAPIRPPNRVADISPEQRDELGRAIASRLRQRSSQVQQPATSSRQRPLIPSAPITPPPEILPPRLASLGFVVYRGSNLTTILVPIPNEDMKGRLIGREGRNLRAFEESTSVTLTIDDTPLAVTLSSPDPIRRTIALLALIKLVTNGRIHPASIQDAVSKARQEVESGTIENLAGEYILPPLCPVPAGPFQMGSDPKRDPDARPNEPLRTVNVPAFQIARYPVTVAEYACFVRAGYKKPEKGAYGVAWPVQLQRLDHPVTCVSWHDATAYATWLARLTGQTWRLPTEEEWEKAARFEPHTGASRLYPWGDTFTGRCNSSESHNRATTPVGAYGKAGAGPCGAEDLAGNVWEWTHSTPDAPPKHCVLRGGSWDDLQQDARAACRNGSNPRSHYGTVGFRLVLAPLGS